MEKLRTDASLPEWPGVQNAITVLNRFTAGTGREGMIILRPDGSVAARYKGDEFSVGPDDIDTADQMIALISGNLVVHSHPRDAELSIPDLYAGYKTDAAGCLACFHGGWSYCKAVLAPADNDDSGWAKFNHLTDYASSVALRTLALHGGRTNNFAATLSNRKALEVFAKGGCLDDYRLFLNDAGKLAFENIPGLIL